MNGMNNPLATGAIGVGMADILPTVQWAMSGFHGGAPASTSALIAGLIIAVVHFGLNWLQARFAAKLPAQP